MANKQDIIPISRPLFGEDEVRLLNEVLESGWITQGPKVRAFEEAFAQKHDVSHAIAITSCTAGLHLALMALDLKPGDEVIVPSFTWIATANVVMLVGATPVLVDVDPSTYNIEVEKVAAAVTEKTKAIIPVHLFGLCADMDALKEVLPDNVAVIEDAACASGASYKGRMAGTLGDAGVFSFHPRKAITTGEGGMITTNDDDLAGRLRILRNHGASVAEEDRHRSPRPFALPEFNVLGINYRMTDLQGALGIAQVKHMRAFIQERDGLARRYTKALADLDWLIPPVIPDEYGCAWQAYVCRVDPESAPMCRNDIMELLQDTHGVSTRPGTHAVHLQNFYTEKFGFSKESFPGALDCHMNTMALPLFNGMTDEQFNRVVDSLYAIG